MDATQEEWCPVVGFEGYYEVSNYGRVRSLDRVVECSDGRRRPLRGRLLNPHIAGRNHRYAKVILPRRTQVYVHALVLEAFVGPRPEGFVACHNDGDGTNNRLSNLRWDTYAENNADLVRHGTHWQVAKTKCKNGHEFTPENTKIRVEGGRKCRKCQKAAETRSHARQRAQGRR